MSNFQSYEALKNLGELYMRIEKNYPLHRACTFGIGGEADAFFTPESESELIEIICLCKENELRYRVIGGGSNLLFSDDGFRGVIICTLKLNRVSLNGSSVTAQCGTMLPKLCGFAARNAISGFEGLCGIPGSVGGALMTAAGAFGNNVFDNITACRVLFPENCRVEELPLIQSIKLDKNAFSYRSSPLTKLGGIILSAEFSPLKVISNRKDEEVRAAIQQKMKEFELERRAKQPKLERSAGSYFKRPSEEMPAAFLIDKSGMKGFSVGGACVSEKHAGFIVNRGNATARDVLMLADAVKLRVNEIFGIELREEVIYVE